MNEKTHLPFSGELPAYEWAKIERARQIREDAAELIRYENAQGGARRLALIELGLVSLILTFFIISFIWAVWDDYQFKKLIRQAIATRA
jgi:hypothetical protein